ncbi:LysR family transcriptional regulator [Enterobacter cancerogenus]|uniref:LysR family transcriptional regulator n=1 Tax=Enterobacter cancerogenus TaxID=69218 RepID=A0A484YVR7_9ENTR|nr:LysR family transcriptional regulator [Enterobacter cancerogenus]
MELRYLRYFVAVARERHFTKAANALGISQPPLSQQIKRLEEEVGTPLFRRLTRGVELTEAGEAFYEDACKILAMSDAALEKARGIARGLNGSLSIGITSSDAFHPKIFTLIRQYQVQNPAVTVHQVEANMASLMAMLAEGELDIAFVRLPCDSSKAFDLKILDREPMVVALHRAHPLADRDALALEALRDTPGGSVSAGGRAGAVRPGLQLLRTRGHQYAHHAAGLAALFFPEYGCGRRRIRAGATVNGGNFSAGCDLSRADHPRPVY